jgi:hypothetical protein
VRDIRIYAQGVGGQVHHWRDQNEIDIIVTLPDGRWGAFEVKMNPVDADKAATSLLSFAEKVDHGKAGPRRHWASSPQQASPTAEPDGVAVLPIGTVRP